MEPAQLDYGVPHGRRWVRGPGVRFVGHSTQHGLNAMGIDNFINVRLIKNPVNWVIVPLMWMLGAMLLHMLTSNWAQQGQSSDQSQSM